MTARELADELEVSIRTVYRDVESLSSAGVPVYADRGPDGGYQLLDGYRTRLTGLTTDEAESLFLTGMPGPAAELGLGAVLAGAELKLLAALPPDLRNRAGRIRERFHLDAPGWFRLPEPAPHLTAVADAVWNQRRVRARYLRWARPREVTRILDPLGVVLKAGSWYLVARCDEEIRTYRVSRVLEVEVLDDPFTRPAGFDLTAFWESWSERFETGVYTGKAVIRFSPEAWRRLPHLVLPATARAAQENAGPPGPDGWVQTVIPIESIRHAHVEVLKFGADAEVLEPPELRARIIDSAHGLVQRYAPAPPIRKA
ncbi:YafY family protein [Actinomadura alba]